MKRFLSLLPCPLPFSLCRALCPAFLEFVVLLAILLLPMLFLVVFKAPYGYSVAGRMLREVFEWLSNF